MQDIFSKLSKSAVIARIEGCKLAWSNVSTVADFSRHPALRRMPVQTPGGVMQGVASPFRREVKGGAVPSLGEHTTSVWQEFAE